MDLGMAESQPILAAPHFYWSSCSVCYKCSSPSSPMKRCTRCQSMYYCSSAHQKMHWKKHKTLCNYLATAADQGGQENFFSGHQGKDRVQWNTFRMNAVKTCSVMLSRALSLVEQEMFLFPRVCRMAGCHSTGTLSDPLQDCSTCYCVAWCSDMHREEMVDQHNTVCRELRLARVADRYECQVSVGLPSLPSNLDKEYLGTAPDITHFVDKPWAVKEEITKEELDFAFLTNQLSGPLTLLDAASRFLPELSTRTSLTVHIAGASLYEMMGIIKWEYLAHRLPNISNMQMVFIGPELEQEEEEQVPVPQCGDCTTLGRSITYQTHSTTYQQMRKVDSTVPDLVLVQNCGFSEYSTEAGSTEWEEGWAGLGHLLHQGSILIFTSYTEGEAVTDLARFLEHCDKEVEVLARCEENNMRSHRPIRDWEQDRDKDVFYSNQFISVVKQAGN